MRSKRKEVQKSTSSRCSASPSPAGWAGAGRQAGWAGASASAAHAKLAGAGRRAPRGPPRPQPHLGHAGYHVGAWTSMEAGMPSMTRLGRCCVGAPTAHGIPGGPPWVLRQAAQAGRAPPSPGKPLMKVVRSASPGMRSRSLCSSCSVCAWGGRFMPSSVRFEMCCGAGVWGRAGGLCGRFDGSGWRGICGLVGSACHHAHPLAPQPRPPAGHALKPHLQRDVDVLADLQGRGGQGASFLEYGCAHSHSRLSATAAPVAVHACLTCLASQVSA